VLGDIERVGRSGVGQDDDGCVELGKPEVGCLVVVEVAGSYR
jgi:hypothetical protein